MARRRDWTGETLAAGVREGDRRALARAITLVENGDPLAYELVREMYPETGSAYVVGITGPPGVGKSTPDRRARPPRARARSRPSASSPSTRRARSRRARCSATASACPSTFSTRASSSARWARAATSAGSPRRRCRRCSPGRGRQGRDLRGDGRNRPERGRGHRDRRHRRARAHAGLRRLDPGAEGGDHGDPGRDRVNKKRPPAAKTMLNEVRSILTLDTERAWQPPIVLTEATTRRGHRRSSGRRSRSTAPTSRRSGEPRGAPPPEPRRRGVRGRLGAGENAPPDARSRTIRSCAGSWTRCRRRELDPLTAVQEIMEKVFKIGDGNGPDTR